MNREIHVVQLDGENIVLHPGSLKFFRVSKDVFQMFKMHERGLDSTDITKRTDFSKKEIKNTLDEFFNKLKDSRVEFHSPKTKKLILNVSHKCNIQCAYCYAKDGSYGLEKQLMSKDIPFKYIDRILEIQKEISILFFGGEPLLNFPLIKNVCTYIDKNYPDVRAHYGIATNGTLLSKEIENFLNQYNVTFLMSLDGPKEINDAQRKSSFSVHDRVVENIKELQRHRTFPLFASCVITHNHLKKRIRIKELIDYYQDLGFDGAHFLPVDVSSSHPLRIRDKDYPQLAQDFAEATSYLLELIVEKKPFYANMLDRIMSLVMKSTSEYLCSAGVSSFTISADGNAYPCYWFIGDEEFVMTDTLMCERCRENTVNLNSVCHSCWNRYLCSGCIGVAYKYNNSISVPYKNHCLIQKAISERILVEIGRIKKDPHKWRRLIENGIKMMRISQLLE